MSRFVHLNQSIKLIKAPASKSYAQRALFAAALSKKPITITNLGKSSDTLHILEIIKQLGCQITDIDNGIIVTPNASNTKIELNVGESGLGTRLTLPIASLLLGKFNLNGKGTLLNRPMEWFNTYMPQMGVTIEANKVFLPISVTGKLNGGNYKVDGSLSSQYISGLLMALPVCKNDSVLTIDQPTSLPYIDITLDVLKDFGIEIINNNYLEYKIKGNQNYQLKDNSYTVESDFSSAAFWIVYGLLNNGIRILNLNQNSLQADKAILDVVKIVGAKYNWENGLTIQTNTLKPFTFDATDCPDLFPILVSLATGIKGKSIIKGTNRLTHKESNRTVVLIEEFTKLGVDIIERDNQLIINGTGQLNSGTINSNSDHRIAMTFAIVSSLTPHGLYISNPECINKSYPEFWDHCIIKN